MSTPASTAALLAEWLPVLLQGAVLTLQISLGAFALGLCIGMLVALARMGSNRALAALARGYTTVCRAVPELLLILLLYYAGGDLLNTLLQALGRDAVELDGFLAGMLVLGIVQGAYASEILRGAIQAVPYGHIEAARALGCPRWFVIRRVMLPEMLPLALAGLSNLWLTLLKDSALISVLGTNELMFSARQAAGTTRHYLAFYLAVGGLYLLITLASNRVVAQIAQRHARWMPRNT